MYFNKPMNYRKDEKAELQIKKENILWFLNVDMQ